MKRKISITFTFLLLFISFSVLAQSPQGFNYQAVARDADGELIKNKSLSIKASILAGSGGTTIVYSETHSVTTSPFGHFSLVVGEGSTTDDISTVEWSANKHFLKMELDKGEGFIVMGSVQLQAVPYALHSNTAQTATTAQFTDSANTAKTVSSVATENIRDISSANAQNGDVLKWDGASWTPAIDNDSFINVTVGKGLVMNEYKISAMNDTSLWNASQLQGYDVDGTSPQVGQKLTYDGTQWRAMDDDSLSVEPGLTLDGSSLSVKYDSAIWNALKLNGKYLPAGNPAKDQYLQFNGSQWSYKTLSSGSGNSPWVTSGTNIYYKNSTGNVGINNDSPNSRLSVRDSLTVSSAGMKVLADHYLYGTFNAGARYVASRNVVIGNGGYSNVAAINATGGTASSTNGENTGTWSEAFGTGLYNVGTYSITGPNATSQSIGAYTSARANSTFNVGVFAVANKSNTNTNYGVFAVGDSASTSYAGYFAGDVNYTGTLTNASDKKLKYAIAPLGNSLSLVKKLEPKSYFYSKTGDAAYLNLSDGLQFGFLAQDLEKVLPELVSDQKQPKGFKKEGYVEYKAVNYVGLIPILTQALKEQQEIIESLESRISELENKE